MSKVKVVKSEFINQVQTGSGIRELAKHYGLSMKDIKEIAETLNVSFKKSKKKGFELVETSPSTETTPVVSESTIN